MRIEPVSHRLGRFMTEKPVISPNAYIAPGATILGAATIDSGSSVWFQSVLRADINEIRVGKFSNIQDGSILHVADRFPVIIGDYVSCGHRSVIHACRVEDRVLVGMGAIIMDGAIIGTGSIIGANTLVTKGSVIFPGSLVIGSPGKIVRSVTTEEEMGIETLAKKYVEVAKFYKAGSAG
jgi:carbonic anhydrase/acetyltransferase-like protein (isoleucine patch superfamily)